MRSQSWSGAYRQPERMSDQRLSAAPILDGVPWSEDITDYDRNHLVLYMRLLDASADGASDEEICCVLLGIDSLREPERAKSALASHLRRARWMTEHGYRQFQG